MKLKLNIPLDKAINYGKGIQHDEQIDEIERYLKNVINNNFKYVLVGQNKRNDYIFYSVESIELPMVFNFIYKKHNVKLIDLDSGNVYKLKEYKYYSFDFDI